MLLLLFFRKHDLNLIALTHSVTSSHLQHCTHTHKHRNCAWLSLYFHYYCYYYSFDDNFTAWSCFCCCCCITHYYYKMLINGRLAECRASVLIAFYVLCEECFREKMYHDPLNTQIMIAIERFHLFSPAAHKKK